MTRASLCWATKRSLNSFSTDVHLGLQLVVERFLFADFLEQRRLRGIEKTIQLRFKRTDLLHRQIVQQAAGAGDR